MGLNKYRNKPCQCGSGIKFKHCCLPNHYKEQAGVVTTLAKKIHEKTAKYWRKRYKAVIGPKPEPKTKYTIGCDLAVGRSRTARKVIASKPLDEPMMGKVE